MDQKIFTVAIFFMNMDKRESKAEAHFVVNTADQALIRMALSLHNSHKRFVLDNMTGWAVSLGSIQHIIAHKYGTIFDMLI